MAQLSAPPTSFSTAAMFRTFSPTLLTPVQNVLRAPDLIKRSMEAKLLLHAKATKTCAKQLLEPGTSTSSFSKAEKRGITFKSAENTKKFLAKTLDCSERFREAFLLFIDSFSSSSPFYTNPTAQHALSGTELYNRSPSCSEAQLASI